MKTCNKCKIEKELEDFPPKKSSPDGRYTICRSCRNKDYNKNYYKYKLRKKLYHIKNKDKIHQAQKEWEKENRSHRAEYQRLRRQNNINIRLKNIIRRRLKEILGSNKSLSSEKYTGINLDGLKSHLQKTAINNGYLNFNINTYSGKEYHVDHIIPCASFNLENLEEQKKCFHYTNLQILKAKTNILKGDKIWE